MKTSLSDLKVKNAKPRAKPYTLSDGEGLYLLIKPDGKKYWRLQYRLGGRTRLRGLGRYPAVMLAAARAAREAHRARIWNGEDPVAERKVAS